MSNPGSSFGGKFTQGVWLSKCEGGKAERLHKWSDTKKVETIDELDRREHSKMVKLNVKQLEVREELASLQKSKNKALQNHLLRGLAKTGSITTSKSDSNLCAFFRDDVSKRASLENKSSSSKRDSGLFPMKPHSSTQDRRKQSGDV